MAKDRTKPEVPRIVKRGEGSGGTRLDPALEALARGEASYIRTERKPAPALSDPRPAGVLIPGVANRDARSVFDARLEALSAYRQDAGRGDELLAEAIWMGLWRAKALTGFNALVEEFLDLSGAEALERATKVALKRNIPVEPLNETLVAVWFRIEAAMIDDGLDGAVATPASATHLDLRLNSALAGPLLHSIGRRMAPLAADHDPRSVARPERRDDGGRRGGRPDHGRDDGRRGPPRDDRRPPQRDDRPHRDERPQGDFRDSGLRAPRRTDRGPRDR